MFSGLLSAVTLSAGLVGTGFVQQAEAQSSVGQVYGSAPAGAKVTLTDTGTGAQITTTASASGQYRFAQVTPGRYRVTAEALSQDVSVVAGLGVEASLGVDTITIVGGVPAVNPIDVRSVESTTILTAEQIENLPINRELSSVALLAPGTVSNASPVSFGNTVSIGGSSVAENGYYLNGFDITNIRTFTSYADIPYDAVAQQQVKTGGYGAEYGRSLGGVISLVTKRGSNDWHWGGSLSYTPEALRGKAKDARTVDQDNIDSGDTYTTGADGQNGFSSADERSTAYWTNYASGPIVKDKLFFWGAVQLQNDEVDTFGRNTSRNSKYTSPFYIGKLDFYPIDGVHLEYTGVINRDIQNVKDYNYTTDANADGDVDTYIGRHEELGGEYDIERGGETHIFKGTFQVTDNLTLSLQHGQLENVNAATLPPIPNVAAGACLAAYDSRGNASALNYIGCWDENFLQIPDIFAGKERDIRKADRIDVDYVLGDHTIRFGYDKETFNSSKVGEIYSGGGYWRYYQRAADFTVAGENVPANSLYARYREFLSNSSSYEVKNEAWYIEDNWQLGDWLLYGGLRAESFANYNAQGEKFVDSSNEIAPRLGFSWDVKGDSTMKLFGNAGRYYIPIAANTNIRASGIEYLSEEFFYVGGINTATGEPTSVGAQIGDTAINGVSSFPPADSVATKNFKPMYQDEFILGFQNQFTDNLMLGVRAIYREVKDGMDDHCTYGAYERWAADQGYTNFDPQHSPSSDGSSVNVPSCQIINPGKDVTLSFDVNDTGVKTLNTVPASYFALPEYKRYYTAVELFGQYTGDNFNINGSYTLSKSRGNVEGYVNSGLGQADAGLTQDFDHFLFEQGAFGNLPNDHTHVFKVFGNYDVTPEFSIGANVSAVSGRPISCLGFVDLTDSDSLTDADVDQLALYAGSSFYCSRPDDSKFLSNRGDFGRTPWTYNADLQLAYKPKMFNGNVGLYVDVRNIFNLDEVTSVNERTQKGTGAAPEYNKDFLQPTAFQTPRSVTFTVRYNY